MSNLDLSASTASPTDNTQGSDQRPKQSPSRRKLMPPFGKDWFVEDPYMNPDWRVLLVNFLLVALCIATLFFFGFAHIDYLDWNRFFSYQSLFFEGFLTTVVLAIFSLVLSFFLGLFFGLASVSRIIPLRLFARIYVELIRGTPLLVQVLIFFYVIGSALGLHNRFVAGVLIMSIFSGAYIAEIVRGGIKSIGKTQRESAMALGFTSLQTYRYIILPQMAKSILPPMAGQFASIIKDSSLLSIISIRELTFAATEINTNTFGTLEGYLPMALGYLILTLPISLWSRRLENRFHYDN